MENQKILLCSSKTNAATLAKAIHESYKTGVGTIIKSIGPKAVNQALKAVAVSNQKFETRITVAPFICVEIVADKTKKVMCLKLI